MPSAQMVMEPRSLFMGSLGSRRLVRWRIAVATNGDPTVPRPGTTIGSPWTLHGDGDDGTPGEGSVEV